MDDFLNTMKDAGHEAEVRRLSDNHEVFKDAMGKLVYAPVDLSHPGKKILDSATADGTWLRDLRSSLTAEHEYFGIDIEPELFPSASEGIVYKRQNIAEPWPNEWKNYFDLVHSRLGLAGAGPVPVQVVVNNLVALCKPGGWVQLIELNVFDPPKCGPAMADFQKLMKEIFSAIGVGDFAQNLKPMLQEAGLDNIQEQRVPFLTGKKAKGDLYEKSMNGSVSAVKPLSAVAKMIPTSFTPEQLESLEGRLREELSNEGGQCELVIAWGQKDL